MKLRIAVQEIVYKTVIINTDDYDISKETKDDEIIETANFINTIKEDPISFISERREEEIDIQTSLDACEVSLERSI